MTTATRPAPPPTRLRRADRHGRAPRALRTKVVRDIRAQWPQFVAITATMLLGVLLFAASYDAYRNLDASYRQTFDQLHGADLYVDGGDVTAVARQAATTAGVEAAGTRIQVDLPLRVGADKVRGRAVGQPTLVAGDQLADLLVLEGRLPVDGEVAVEQHMADHFGLAPGDAVEALGPDGWTSLDVAGTVVSVEYLWPARSRQELFALPDDFGVVFTTATTAESLAGAPADEALVRYAQGSDTAELDQQLGEVALGAGATAVTTWEEQPSNSLLQEDVDGFSEMATSFPVLFLGAAAMATYVLLTRRVQSERDIIGMLLASGVRRRHVLLHYLGYGLAAGLVGGVVGVLLGVPTAREMTRLYLSVISLPPDVAVVDWRPLTAVGGVAYGIAAGTLAGLAPALAASRVPPAEAMRPVVPASGGRRSLVERLVPPVRRLPARWLMVVRGIGRNRRRTLSTVLGVVLSLLLILVSWGMIDTMDALLAKQFDVVQRQDARVDLVPGEDGAPLQELRAIDGVETAERSITLPVGIATAEDSYGTTLIALSPDTRMHGFVAPDGERLQLPDDGLLVGKAMVDLLGLEVGDTVSVRTADGQLSVDTVVRGFVDEPLGTFAYTSLERFEEVTGGTVETTSVYLRFTPEADRTAVRRAAVDLPGVAAFEDAQTLQEVFEQLTGLFYGFIGAMLALGGLMAFAIIFTTMSVNILERSREIATLHASGVPSTTLARLITAENLLTTLLGIVPGLVVGVIGASVMLDHYSSDQFDLSLVVRPATLVGAAGVILVVALLSQWPGLRALRRLDIATVVREHH